MDRRQQMDECREDDKRSSKFKLYHRRTNAITSHILRYFIQMVGVSDQQKSLAEVFDLFIYQPTNTEPSKGLPHHQIQQNSCLFEYFVCLYFLHNCLVDFPSRPTQDITKCLQDIFGRQSFCSSAEEDLAQKKQLVIKCKQKVTKIVSEQTYQTRFARHWHAFLCLKDQYLTAILNKPRQFAHLVSSELLSDDHFCHSYLDALLTKLYDTHFSYKDHNRLLLNALCSRYQTYLNMAPTKLRKVKKRPYNIEEKPGSISIRRYTANNRDEVLMTLKNLVGLRKKGVNYEMESFQIGKQVIRELQRHYQSTHCHYPLLNSESVIFNQLTLQIQLAYENILHQALGLLRCPAPIENMICCRATPYPFDTYSAPIEHRGLNQVKLYHKLYGFHVEKDQELAFEVQKERKEKQQIMKESQGWRCLMVISYLMSGVEYHQAKGKACASFYQFITFIQQQSKVLQKDILKVLGPVFMKLALAKRDLVPFSWEAGVGFFNELIKDEEQFEILPGIQFVKLNNLLRIKKLLIKETVSLIDHKLFQKVSNPIKYLAIFYLSLVLELQNVLTILDYLQADLLRGVALLKSVNERVNLLSEVDKKGVFWQKAATKLRKYQQQKGEKEIKRIAELREKYPEEFDGYQALLFSLEAIKKRFIAFNQNSDGQGELNEQMHRQLKQFKQEAPQLEDQLMRSKSRAAKIVDAQFVSRGPRDKGPEVKYVQLKLQLLVKSLLKISKNNLVLFELTVLPCLQAGEREILSSQKLQLMEYLKLIVDEQPQELL